VTICPCCGFKFAGTLRDGCKQCGARAVGAALPKPAQELPSYGRALILVVTGSLLVLVFATQTIIAMVQKAQGSLGRFFQFWTWVAAGETAAWRLKWVSIPVMFVTLWCGVKLYRSIRLQPERFCGLRYARRGLLASATVGLLIAVLIGVTVPARLRQRQMSIDAGYRAQYYTLEIALTAYQKKYKTLPDQSTLKEDLSRLPDPDGMIAAALRDLDPTGYQPRGEVAAVDTQKGRALRGGAIIRKASLTTATDDTPPPGLAFTDYDLRLPGEDKILGTEDDWVGRDGVIMRLADVAKGGVGRSVSAGVLNP
jgi:hypothetical protein